MPKDGEILTAIQTLQSSLHAKIDTGFSEVHGRLDDQGKQLGSLGSDLAVVQATMPEVPCAKGNLNENTIGAHIRTHEETKGMIKRGAIALVFTVLGVIIIWKFGIGG